MDQNMTERKAFWHALMTVGIAVLLITGFLFFLVGPHSEHWLAFALIISVPALIMLPFVYRRYMEGPRPPLSRQEHLRHAVWCAFIAAGYFVLYWGKQVHVKSVWSWSYVGLWLVLSLNHLRQAYKRQGTASPAQ
jgi:hypothetical protein